MKQHKKHSGISLLEMLVSLGIFTVIVLPLVSLPIKAKEQNNDTINTDKLNALVSDTLLNTLAKDINGAVSFMPISNGLCLDSSSPCTANSSNYLFLASPSLNRSLDTRVAYRIKQQSKLIDFGDVSLTGGGSGSSQPPSQTVVKAPTENIYLLQRLVIPDNTDISTITDSAYDSQWVTLGDRHSSKKLTFTSLRFVYCKNGTCSTANAPNNADGVELTATSGADTAFTIKVGSTTFSQNPIYYKLGSQQANIDGRNKIFAFPVQLKQYNTLATLTAGANTYYIADPGFDYKTGEVIMGGTDGTNLYINKCKPEVGCPSWTSGSGGAYERYLPFSIPLTKLPNYTSSYTFQSITQDNDGNIYVLAVQSGASALVFKFSPQGVPVSSFFLPSTAAYITFDPSTPDEILVLGQTISGSTYTTRIYSYLSDPPEASPTALILPTATANISASGIGNNAVTGFDIDPFSNRFVISYMGGIKFVPHYVDGSDLQSRTITEPLPVNVSGGSVTSFNVTGITYDPLNNRLLSSAPTTNVYNVVSIGSNSRPDRNYQ